MRDDPVILLNILDVDPARQHELVDLLREGLDEVIGRRPGLESATILASQDGTRVVNLARWRSAADIAATQADPSAAAYAQRTATLAKAAPNIYRIVHDIP